MPVARIEIIAMMGAYLGIVVLTLASQSSDATDPIDEISMDTESQSDSDASLS